jgi:hypothetical protein
MIAPSKNKGEGGFAYRFQEKVDVRAFVDLIEETLFFTLDFDLFSFDTWVDGVVCFLGAKTHRVDQGFIQVKYECFAFVVLKGAFGMALAGGALGRWRR